MASNGVEKRSGLSLCVALDLWFISFLPKPVASNGVEKRSGLSLCVALVFLARED